VFEHKSAPVLSRREFARRMAGVVAVVGAIVAGSLAVGVIGYHVIAGFGWVDSLLNASMILSAMGPVDHVTSDAAKIFASCYALFSGVVLITSLSVVIAPVFHRVLHRFHVEAADDPE
jgi:hypothetical protein